MKLISKIEEIIYKNAGGGEAGEKAVMARREYLEEHKLFMKSQLKEFAKLKAENERLTKHLENSVPLPIRFDMGKGVNV